MSKRKKTIFLDESTSEVNAKRKRLLEEPVAGTIKGIHLRNFMCHEELIWTQESNWSLHPGVNVICGQNGSGKSSIIQAMVLALGAHAKDTKRSTTVGDFVRHDASKAEIKVTLCNEGDDAFRPEKYGKEIGIERVIYANGSSKIAIYDENKQMVYKDRFAREEREHILQAFQIETSNPMTVLQQEEAKNFFNAENPSALYDFFEKCTSLQFSRDYYQNAEKDINTTNGELKVIAKERERLDEEKQALEKKLNHMEVRVNVTKEMRDIKLQIKWGNVYEKERIMKTKENNLKKHTVEEDDRSETNVRELSDAMKELEDTKIQFDDVLEKIEKCKVVANNFKNDIDEGVKSMKKAEEDLRQTREAKAIAFKEVMFIEKTIRDHQRMNNNNVKQNSMLKFEEKMKGLQEKKESISRELEESGKKRDKLQGELHGLEQKKKTIEDRFNQIKRQKDQFEADINKLKRSSSDLSAHDQSMQNLCHDIDKNISKFRKRPVGPLSRYIRLKGPAASDANLALLLETELNRRFLESFIVDNKEDQLQLERLMRNHYRRSKPPSIYLKKFNEGRYRIADKAVKTTAQMPGLLDLLHFENDEVFNTVVDWKRIEGTLVVTQADAQKLFRERRTVPRNANKAITPDWFRYEPPTKGNYSSYYIRKPPPYAIPFLKSENQGELLKNNLNQASSELHGLTKEKNGVMEKINFLFTQRNKVLEKMDDAKFRMTKVGQEMSSTRNELERRKQEESTDDLAKKKREKEQEVSELESKMAKLSQLVNLEKKRTEELKKEYETATTKVEVLEDDFDKWKKRLDEVKMEVKVKETVIKKLEAKKKAKSSSRLKAEEEFEKAKREYEFARQTALDQSNGKVIELKYTKSELQAKEKEYDKLRRRKDKAIDGCSIDELTSRIIEVKRKEEMIKKRETDVQRTVEKARKMSDARKMGFIQVRKDIILMIRRNFGELMSGHGLQGKLRFCFDDRSLDITVRHEGSDIPLFSLSGGERSKTLLCLLLSIWRFVQSPFRILDEWDVFLDDVARERLTRRLLESAVQSRRQHIILSPQWTFKDLSHKVNVIQLRKR